LIEIGCIGKKNIRRYLIEAARYEESSKYKKAIGVYRNAIDEYPRHAVLYHRLGYVYQLLNDFSHAEESYLKAIDNDNFLIDSYVNLSALYFNEGLIRRGRNILEEALRVNPSAYYVHLNLAQILYVKGEVKKAIEHYHIALQLRKDDPVPCYNLGVIYFQDKSFGKAIQFLEMAIERDSSFCSAYELLGLIYEEKNDIEKAGWYWKKRADYGKKSDPMTRLAAQHYRILIRQ